MPPSSSFKASTDEWTGDQPTSERIRVVSISGVPVARSSHPGSLGWRRSRYDVAVAKRSNDRDIGIGRPSTASAIRCVSSTGSAATLNAPRTCWRVTRTYASAMSSACVA